MQRRAVVIGVAAVLLLALAGGCTDSAGPGGGETTEYKLAIVNAGGYVPKDDPTVAQFRALLDSIGAKCDAHGHIPDYAVSSRDLLRQKGVRNYSLLQVMQAADDSMPAGSGSLGLDCAEVFASLVSLISQ